MISRDGRKSRKLPKCHGFTFFYKTVFFYTYLLPIILLMQSAVLALAVLTLVNGSHRQNFTDENFALQ